MERLEDYAKAAVSFIGGNVVGAFASGISTLAISKVDSKSIDVIVVVGALAEVSLFMISLSLLGPRLGGSANQLFYTVGGLSQMRNCQNIAIYVNGIIGSDVRSAL